MGEVPSLAVPMRLPATALLSELISTPSSSLPERVAFPSG
jgi:hypothetical protein